MGRLPHGPRQGFRRIDGPLAKSECLLGHALLPATAPRMGARNVISTELIPRLNYTPELADCQIVGKSRRGASVSGLTLRPLNAKSTDLRRAGPL